jgi:peptidoglycan glycosyltransferase
MERAADAVVSGYLLNPTSRTELALLGQTVLQTDRRLVGHNVVLTIDAGLQEFALECFRTNGWRGAAVALDPNDGSVRLLCTAPSFDPNGYDPRAIRRIPGQPLVNRALQGLYPPGSTFKTAIAALAIDAGKAGTYFCPADGWVPPGARQAIHDHEYFSHPGWAGFGSMGIRQAFAKSSNTYFAQAGVASGPVAFNALAEALCLNRPIRLYESPSGSAISSNAGSVPVLGTRRRDLGELSQLSIGQGKLQLTPLHVAMLVSAIANDGVLYRPRIVETDDEEILSTPFLPSTARAVRDLMREVVLSGTGRRADIPGLEVAGKTGTAQNPHGKDHGWFVCLAPVSRPQLVVAVVVENQGFGSQTALPIARAILEKARDLGYVTPSEESVHAARN